MPALFLLLTSCKGNEEPPAEPAPRTVLVYMAANNGLGAQGNDDADIAEIAQAARNGLLNNGCRVLLYHSDYQGSATLTELAADGSLMQHETYTDGKLSVQAERMSKVLTDARRIAPAGQFGLILWSHGSGWLEDGITEKASSPRKRSWGEENGRKMNITTLQSVLRPVHPDWIYFDCCYMASVEVAYQLRNVTDAIVASATELPADGMPYQLTLPYLLKLPDANLTGAAATTFGHYNAMSGQMRTCTMSVISTAGMDNLAQAAREINTRISQAGLPKVPDGFTPQAYSLDRDCPYFDLGQYMEALAEQLPDCNSLLARWRSAMDAVVLYSAATPKLWDKLSLEHCSGLSTFLLRYGTDPGKANYTSLDWPTAAGLIQ